MNTVNLWLPASGGSFRLWEAGRFGGELGLSELQQRLEQASGAVSVVLYLPTLEFTLVTKDVSKAQVTKLGSEGVKFLLENDSLIPVDELGVRSVSTEEGLQLCGISSQVLRAYKELFASLGAELAAVLPDFLLLPEPAESSDSTGSPVAIVLRDHEVNLLRTSKWMGQDIGLMDAAHSDEIDASHPLEVTTGELGPLERPFAHAFAFAFKGGETPRFLKWLMGLFVAVLLVWSCLGALRLYVYHKAETSYRSQITEQFKQWYPNERPQLDLRRQLETKISEPDQPSQLVATLARIRPMLSGVTVERFKIDDQRLWIALSAEDQAELDRVIGLINQNGFSSRFEPAATGTSGLLEVNLGGTP